MKAALTAVILLLAGSPCWARSEKTTHLAAGAAGFDTNIVWQILDNGYLRTLATNYGYFGTVNGRLRDSTGEILSVMEAPPLSGIEYLYEAGLWIGGVVGDDTLVSTGSLGFGLAHELYADAPVPPAYTDLYGDEEWSFSYSDTTTDPETVREDPYDGIHRPLPVHVRQKTYVFDAISVNPCLFVDLVITNAGTLPIESLWVGWMVDPDIGHEDTDDYWQDDITGHERRTVIGEGGSYDITFAWAMDNDGDPDSTEQFDARSARRALLSMYLGGTPQLSGESYNWWIPSVRRAFDWGPQVAPGDTNVLGGRGYALTDAFRFRLLSNREIDYPMPYAAVNRTAEGWIPPTVDSIARDFADGFDARFLHSAGAVTLAPHDSLVIHWVFVVSRNAHTNPSYFRLAFNAADPRLYLSGIGLTAIGYFMSDLKTTWDKGFTAAPIRHPRGFRLQSWDAQTGTLAWDPRGTLRLGGYLLRRQSSDSPTTSYIIPATESTYVDTGLNRSSTYYYSVASLNALNAVGSYSPPDSLLPDRPRTPRTPLAVGRKRAIHLEWPANEEPDLTGYRIYRRNPGGEWAVVDEIAGTASYVDSSVETARVYEYRITALSALAHESYPSESAEGVAFAFDGPAQIVDYTQTGPFSLTDKDSVAAVWKRLMMGAVYRDASQSVTPFEFADFNPHPATVIVSDGRSPLPASNFELFDLYSNAQGATIITGRDLFNPNLALDTLIVLPENSIGRAAGIRAAYYPRPLAASPTRMNAEFIAARPVDPALPWLEVDSGRTAWGLNPALPHPGKAIPFAGYFEVDTARAEVLYTFESRFGSASALHGKPAAVMSREPARTLAVFAFPLSYLGESDVAACVKAILARMGYGSTRIAGDADNDGAVTAADLVLVIDYLFRGGSLINEGNADVSGDCRVDVLDVVFLLRLSNSESVLTETPCP